MKSKNNTAFLKPFVRTPFTWLMYLLIASYCYMQVSPGSIVPYLHTELHLNYTLDSLHISSLALGSIIAGLGGSVMGRYWHRRTLIWTCMGFMLAGALLLALGHQVPFTLLGFFCCGMGGAGASVFIQSALADYYGDQRATAITEANTACSAAAVLSPLCLSASVALGIGWRGMVLIPFLAVGLLALFWRKIPIADALQHVEVKVARPAAAKTGHVGRVRLPGSYWLYWLSMVLMIGIEWGIVFWGSGYLIHVVGIERNWATTLMSLFFVAGLLARVIGSWLTRRFSAESILPVALVIGGVGFLLFWLGSLPILNVAGLFIAGFGIANLFPLSYAAAANRIPEHADLASALGILGGGIAIFLSPFVLGRVADIVGLRLALTCILFLFSVCIVVLVLARHAVRSHASQETIAEAEPVSQEPPIEIITLG